MQKLFRLIIVSFVFFVVSIVMLAQDDEIEPATIVNDEGGVVAITGEVEYTNAFFTAGVSEPVIILEDQTGFVLRDEDYLFPEESQVLGQITSDFFTSPFTYSLSLPFEPQAPLNDVDNDDEEDTGVMVFQIAYWTNTFGDGFLQERDLYGGGWSGAYTSARVSVARETFGEYVGGVILVYAPDDEQAFPSGFGDDGLLFTEDDPLVLLPAGYTIVDMDTEEFTFDRSREITVDLLEGEGAEADDFSEMSYTEAFDALLEKFRNEYSFTEYKNLDWDALEAEYRPLFEEAEEEEDIELYARALTEFTWEIPDGHVYASSINIIVQDFFDATDGGIGIAVRELSDGRVIVNFVLEDSPADEAGIELGTEIVEINGTPILEATDEAIAWSAPFSTDHVRRLQQLRYVTRFELGDEVDVTFINDDGDEETVTLEAIAERTSFNFSSFNASTSGLELPVEWEYVGDYLLVDINSFFDDSRLSALLWERMIRDAQNNGVPSIIIDMRNNGGGSGWLADQMAAYFFQEPLVTGNSYFYDEESDEFIIEEDSADRFYLPPEDLYYGGNVVILVGPNCASACEFFSYNMTLQDRATIVGQYPTAGLGGAVEQFFMPEGVTVQLTITRGVDPDGEIHIEGIGVVPDVVVSVDEDTLGLTDAEFINNDPILDAAVAVLDEISSLDVVDAGEIGYDEEATGEIVAGQRVQYTFTVLAGEEVAIYLGGDLDTYLRVYDETGENLLAENDDLVGLNSGIEEVLLEEDLTVIIEVATYDDAESGDYTLYVTTDGNPLED
ncbi:MAG: S41 family peptidase [Phototrophicaceae bacterium]